MKREHQQTSEKFFGSLLSFALLTTVLYSNTLLKTTPGLYSCENQDLQEFTKDANTSVGIEDKSNDHTVCAAPYEENTTSSGITRFLLIRHGKTEWNVQKRIQTHADIPLNDLGKQQAETVTRVLIDKHEKINALYSSDLQRAVGTAAPIARAFGLETITNPLLREHFMGEAEGMFEDDYKVVYGPAEHALDIAYPNQWERWQHIPVARAETAASVFTRVDNVLKEIAKKHPGQTVAVVTHGAVMKTLISFYTGAVERISNCCIAEIHYNTNDDSVAFINVLNLY